MKITKVEWRNFTSYGNKIQSLDLSGDPLLYQIVGENGAGKTSISQVIMFALYGKVEGKKLKDIPNRINGNAWTRVTLDHYGTPVVVERGLEPNVFKLFIDGSEYDKAGTKSVQDYLTDDILGIPYYVFNNTILLSINDFKSFIKMSPQDKRAIVDKIFGFHILNQMRDVLKGEFKKIKESIDTIGGKILSLESSIKGSQEEMDNLTEEIRETRVKRIDEIEKSILTFTELSELHSTRVNEFKETEKDVSEKIKSANTSLLECNASLREITNKMHLFEHDKCPTCESDLNTSFHESLKKSLIDEKGVIEKKIDELEKAVNDLSSKENELVKLKGDLLEKGLKIKNKIQDLIDEKSVLSSDSSDKESSALQRIIDSLQKDLTILSADKVKSDEKQNWLKLIDDVLGEKGVKQMAIRTILPSLNSEILDLLSRMHLQYQVVFDEEFNATIYHMGIEIPSQTLSTGEMKKVDFIVLISIMKLMKMKFSNINLLFLDELFSSVDPDGVHSIISILKGISKELGLNIFVINHAPMPHEIFDWKLDITKSNNFSSINLERF
jgi:DNA repair exonuclease SbcCD ATPase subunit